MTRLPCTGTSPEGDIAMTDQSTPYKVPQAVLVGTPELPAALCTRCGAVGTHYLTCPVLRLPSGYRLSDDPGP